MAAVIEAGEDINKIGFQYINRLSDYFFVIACLVNLKLGVNETVYKKSKKIFKSKDWKEKKWDRWDRKRKNKKGADSKWN